MEQKQLDRIEAKVDEVHKIVHQHVGVISAVKWLLAGLGTGFSLLLGFLGLRGH